MLVPLLAAALGLIIDLLCSAGPAAYREYARRHRRKLVSGVGKVRTAKMVLRRFGGPGVRSGKGLGIDTGAAAEEVDGGRGDQEGGQEDAPEQIYQGGRGFLPAVVDDTESFKSTGTGWALDEGPDTKPAAREGLQGRGVLWRRAANVTAKGAENAVDTGTENSVARGADAADDGGAGQGDGDGHKDGSDGEDHAHLSHIPGAVNQTRTGAAGETAMPRSADGSRTASPAPPPGKSARPFTARRSLMPPSTSPSMDSALRGPPSPDRREPVSPLVQVRSDDNDLAGLQITHHRFSPPSIP